MRDYRSITVQYFCILVLALLSTAPTSGQTNGTNVRVVKYAGGTFNQVGSGGWEEHDPGGNVHQFSESSRDEWSVYLLDQSRDITIQLDLYKKEIYIYWDRPERRKLYDILEASDGATGEAPAGPAGYTQCAVENESHTFSTTVDVAYGTNGQFAYKKNISGTVEFNNATFGDPLPGVQKFGYYRAAESGAPPSNPDVTPSSPSVAPSTEPSAPAAGNFLSAIDEKKVLEWISGEVTDAKAEYCWKRSHPRATEGLTSCPPGSEKSGELCYPVCPAGFVGAGPVCWHDCPPGYTNNGPTCFKGADTKSSSSRLGDCPPGYTNTGLTCFRGASTYSAASTVADCPSGYKNMGASCYRAWPPDSRSMESMTCPSGRFRKGGRCYVNCKPGYTNNGEFCGIGASSLGMSSMTCPQGYFQGPDARCHQNCPDGYTNTGETCYLSPSTLSNSSSERGVGSPMKCKDGLISNGAGLCFEPCPEGMTASSDADPVCWSPCGGNQTISCGAGCSNSQTACAQETWNMVEAVGEMAMNIVSLGETSEFTVAKSAVKTAVKAGDKAAAKAAAKLAVKELAKGFEKLTTRKVVQKLREKFTENAAKWVEEEYATLLLKTEKNNDFSTDDLWDLAGLDPTGVAEVVHAFYKPVCAKDNPFPDVQAH